MPGDRGWQSGPILLIESLSRPDASSTHRHSDARFLPQHSLANKPPYDPRQSGQVVSLPFSAAQARIDLEIRDFSGVSHWSDPTRSPAGVYAVQGALAQAGLEIGDFSGFSP
jgi:hypothetical protein